MKRRAYALGKWGYHWLTQFGFNPIQCWHACKGLPFYLANYIRLARQRPLPGQAFKRGRLYPCLGDRFETGGRIDRHYFHQDLWVAQRIFENRPAKHVDIGSRLDGFVTQVAAFREIEVWDLRPSKIRAHNIRFGQADIMDRTHSKRNYCDSVSCLSVLEHLGLGRYGDRVDVQGHLVGWENIHRLLKPGGKLYFSVPIGAQRIEFDAHRVFSLAYLRELLQRQYHLDTFVYIDDEGRLIEPGKLREADWQNNYGCDFGCGIFELTKHRT